MNGLVRRVALAVAWVAVAAVIALGAAGLVAAMAHQPGTASRPELTWTADQAAGRALEAARTELDALTEDVRDLGVLGRGALAALVGSDAATLAQAVTEGQALAGAIDARTTAIREALALVPGTGPDETIRLSPAVLERRDVLRDALDATQGLSAGWARLAAGALTATRVSTLLTDHDAVAGEAAEIGRSGAYAEALVRLEDAEAMIVEARTLRDGLANTVDVSTLTQWLDRNAEYDAAIRTLYEALVASDGRVTDEVRAAFAAERTARNNLPTDTRGLVVILSEIARGGLNQAVIGIEQARGDLEAALGRLAEPTPGTEASPAP